MPGNGDKDQIYCFIILQLVFFCKELIVTNAFFFSLLLSSLVHSLFIKERTSMATTLGSWQESILIIVSSNLPGEAPSKS